MSDQIKPGMIRAKTKDGMKVGWYFRTYDGKHFIIRLNVGLWYFEDAKTTYMHQDSFSQIEDISSAAEATGKKDKNGDMIFGSRGEMQGGDRVKNGDYVGNPDHWRYWTRSVVWGDVGWCGIEGESVEIIKPEEGK